MKKILVYPILALTFIGCSNDKDEPQFINGGELNFSASVVNPSEADSEHGSTTLVDGDNVGIYILNSDNSTFYYNNARLVADASGTLKTANSLVWPEGASSLTAIAYVPYNEDWNGNNNSSQKFTVASNQRAYADFRNSDLLYGTPSSGNPCVSNNINISFNHVFSLIDVIVSDKTGGYDLTTANMSINDVAVTTLVEPLTGVSSTASSEVGNILPYKDIATARRLVCQAVLPPQGVAAGVEFITIEIGEAKLRYALPDNASFLSNAKYMYEFSITTSGLHLDSSQVSDWREGNEQNIKPDDNGTTPDDPTQNGYDIYLCIGSTNMAGRAPVTGNLEGEIDGVYLLNADNVFEPASNPLNKYSTIRKELSFQRLGIAWSFSRKLRMETGRKIGLVVNSRSDTQLADWQKGAGTGYYEKAIERVKTSMSEGTLRGIIWHQEGEDCRSDLDRYELMLSDLISDFRADLGNSELPVVIGEVATWNWLGTESGSSDFNNMLAHLAESDSFVSVASAAGLTPLDGEGSFIFSAEGILTLGERYSDAIKKMTK